MVREKRRKKSQYENVHRKKVKKEGNICKLLILLG